MQKILKSASNSKMGLNYINTDNVLYKSKVHTHTKDKNKIKSQACFSSLLSIVMCVYQFLKQCLLDGSTWNIIGRTNEGKTNKQECLNLSVNLPHIHANKHLVYSEALS